MYPPPFKDTYSGRPVRTNVVQLHRSYLCRLYPLIVSMNDWGVRMGPYSLLRRAQTRMVVPCATFLSMRNRPTVGTVGTRPTSTVGGPWHGWMVKFIFTRNNSTKLPWKGLKPFKWYDMASIGVPLVNLNILTETEYVQISPCEKSAHCWFHGLASNV